MRNEWKNTTLESALGWQSQDNQAVSARDSAYWPSLIVLHNDGSDYDFTALLTPSGESTHLLCAAQHILRSPSLLNETKKEQKYIAENGIWGVPASTAGPARALYY